MAIGRITGPMLFSNLDRQGVNLAIDTNLVYIDVGNRRLGVGNTSPGYTLDVNGNAHLGNLYVLGNTISSETGRIGLGSISSLTVTGGNLNNVIITDGAGSLSFTNVGSLPDLVAANTAINTINANVGAFESYANATFVTSSTETALAANVGAYQIWANANIGTLYLGNISTSANLGAYQTYANANAATQATSINTINANVGAFEIYANANIGAVYNHVNTLDANVGSFEIYANANIGAVYNHVNTLDANVGAFHIYANANIGTLYLGNISTNANLGAYQIYANANAATQATNIDSINANVGAYEIYANANIGTLYLGNISTQANLGAYQTYANANAAVQATSINTINANLGAFETYANIAFVASAGAYGNANVAAYLPTYTGNLNPGNVTSRFYGNISTDVITPYQTTVTVFNSTTAITLPIGANSARPSTPVAGQIRYNNEVNSVEFYNGTSWVNVISNIDGQNFYGDGVNNTFTLNHGTTQTGIIVSINGALQQPGYSYTVSGNQITFNETPLVTDQIDIRFLAAATVNATDTNIIDTGNITVGTSAVTIDSWPVASYRSAKYVISSSNPFDAEISDVQVVHNGINSYVNAINLPTGANTITYTTSISSGNVIVQAVGSTVNNKLRIQRTYFLI